MRSIRKFRLRVIVLCLLFTGIFIKRRKTPTSIVYSLSSAQVYFNSSPTQVLRVLSEERFSSRANLRIPLVEVRSLKTLLFRDPNFTYDAALHILFKVLPRRNYWRFFQIINKQISKLEFSFAFELKNFKENIFDHNLYSIFFAQRQNKIDLITTQSSFFKLPSSFGIINGPRKIMAWYSTNSKPIYACDDNQRKEINVDAFKDIVDEHWVWNKGEIAFLRTYGIKNVVAVGPVIFQEKITEEADRNKFVITYFDVTPLQASDDFYSEKNATLVLHNILRLGEKLESKYPGMTVIQIKPKRKYSKYHAKSYISLLLKSSKQMKIKLLPASANLYQTISKSDLVLAIPFTSPALLGRELNVNSFFISTGIHGWDVPKSSEGIPVIFEFEELLNQVEKEIESKFRL